MASLHVLAIPFPAQGHVIPLMELSQCLAVLGFRVTFVNSDFDHKRVLRSLPGSEGDHIFGGRIRLVSIPDGLEPGEDRNDIARLCQSFLKVMPGELERLIGELNGRDGEDKVSCVIADFSMSWAFEVAKKMGIQKVAAFWPASAALLAVLLSIPRLIEDGVIDENGTPLKHELTRLDPTMPEMNPSHLSWTCMGELESQKILFSFAQSVYKLEDVEWLLCNSSIDLESGTFEYMPRFLPVGPLLASNRLGSTAGHFWPPEDAECLDWLDHQPPRSVIYVAFGSFTVFNQCQFEELAQGLGMTGMPFLWVIRPDSVTTGKNSVPSNGKVVGWAPQQEVLRHPSVACFLSHCGWNSTIEGVSNGVPFLCWPYFCDQFFNETYICDVWKVGVRLDRDESGIVRRDEIVAKVEALLGSSKDGDGFRKRASEMKEKVINGGKECGKSYQNRYDFVDWLKSSKE